MGNQEQLGLDVAAPRPVGRARRAARTTIENPQANAGTLRILNNLEMVHTNREQWGKGRVAPETFPGFAETNAWRDATQNSKERE